MNNPILEALELLHNTYPTEQVGIWVERTGSGPIRYIGRVCDPKTPTPSEFGHGETAIAAAEATIKTAGERKPEQLLDKRIAQLREELAMLQQAQDKAPTNVRDAIQQLTT